MLNVSNFLDRRCALIGAAALLFTMSNLMVPNANAQTFPNKPITLIVPYPPGGATDILARVVSKGLSARLGQSVVVENKAGAGTSIGAQAVAQAAPDGHTLLISGNTTFTINPALKSKLPYDPVNGLTGVGILGHTALVLLANPSVNVTNAKDVAVLSKSQAGKMGYGTFGIGTSTHFAGEMFKVMSGASLNHIPYRGSAPSMADLIGGQIPFAFDTTIAGAPQIAAGKVKPIAVTTRKRVKSLPNVPTFAESGYPDYELSIWIAIVGPKGLPDTVQQKLGKALSDTMQDTGIRAELEKIGLEVDFKPGSAYAGMVAKELPLMRAYVHKANIPIE